MVLHVGSDALELYGAIRAKSDLRWRILDTFTTGETLHIADAAFYDEEKDNVTVVRMLLADHENIRVSLTFLSPPDSASPEQLADTSTWKIDKTTLPTPAYTTAIFETLFYTGAIEPSYEAKGKVLQLGVGCGAMYNFVESAFPNIELTGVELSPIMVEMAKKWYHLKTSNSQKCVVGDGIVFLAKEVERGEKYDAILVDATYCGLKDAGDDEFLGPVPPFRDISFFECAKKALTPTGCLIINVVTGHGDEATLEAAKKFEESLLTVFSHTSNEFRDGNAAIGAANRPMPEKEEIKKRVDALKFKVLPEPTRELDSTF